ncbi:MAG: helix-turn-helix transcriptional regulator [Phycisphaerales bacterium]
MEHTKPNPPVEPEARTLRLALSPVEVAAALGISRAQVFRLESSGRLPRPIRLGRIVRWDRATFEAWLAAGAPRRESWELLHSSQPPRPKR